MRSLTKTPVLGVGHLRTFGFPHGEEPPSRQTSERPNTSVGVLGLTDAPALECRLPFYREEQPLLDSIHIMMEGFAGVI